MRVLGLPRGFHAAAATRTEAFHRLYLRNNPAPGIVRLGVWLSMGWIGFVLWRYADPSVTGIYVGGGTPMRSVELVTVEALSPILGPRILAEARDVLRAA